MDFKPYFVEFEVGNVSLSSLAFLLNNVRVLLTLLNILLNEVGSLP